MQVIVLAIALLALSPAPTGADVAVPERFVGAWASSPASCGSDVDDLALRLAPRHIYYWESDGPVRSVEMRGDEIALIVELSGGGETWLAAAKFKLSSDGRMLTDNTGAPGNKIVRYRCSESAGTRADSGVAPA